MRPFNAMIAAALLLAGAAPIAARADAPGPSAAAAPGCHCPPVRRHVVRTHRRVWHHARSAPPPEFVPAPIPAFYNPALPSPWDTDYDRGMVLHFRSPAVAGVYIPEPGYSPLPPILGVQPYRYAAAGAVMQYDGLTGEYIALAQPDAAMALPPPPPPPPKP